MLFAACTLITGDLGRVIAIDVYGPVQRTVEEDDTLQLSARAIDASGDSVPDAGIVWVLMDIDSGQVGFLLDSLTGLIQARSPGSGRVRARVDELYSAEVTITVSAAPDSIGPAGEQQLAMGSDDAESPRLRVAVYDLTTDPDSILPLADKPVQFDLTDPLPGSGDAQGFFLTAGDSIPGSEPHRAAVSTSSTGEASIVIRRIAGSSLPDSAVVDAAAFTAVGGTVAGSPVRFILRFAGGQ